MPRHAATRAPKPAGNGHDHNLPVNRAPSQTWIRDWRQRIRTAELLNRLQVFSLDDPENPTGPRMTRTQATVALSLLRKVLPDMQALEISGNSEKPLVVQVLRFSDGMVIDADHNSVGSPTISSDLPDVPLTQETSVEPKPLISMQTTSIPTETESYIGDLPPAIEHNARLIEDEPPKRKASPRRTSRRKQNQGLRRKPAAERPV